MTRYVLFDHKVQVELRFDGLRQMDEFQNMDAALSFAEGSISDERKVLIFILGLSLGGTSCSRSVPPWMRSMRQ